MEVSRLTTNEWVFMKSSWEILNNDKFKCSKCNADKLSESLKNVKHCSKISSNPLFYIRDQHSSISFNNCIGNYYDHGFSDLLDMHSLYQLGVMPFKGSPMDQPAKLIEVFDVISSMKSDKLEKELKKNKVKNTVRGNRLGR